MKKRMYLFIALFAGASGLYAQDCAIGYCPSTIVVHHKIGDLSAETKDITYNVVKITTTVSPTCWITQNLGAPSTPTAYGDYSSSYSGWGFQLGTKKGLVDGATLPITTWTNFAAPLSLWPVDKDPCTATFGSAWRLPTSTEWTNAVYNAASWSTSPKPNVGYTWYISGTNTWDWWTTSGSTFYACRDIGVSDVSKFGHMFYGAVNWNSITKNEYVGVSSGYVYGSAAVKVRCLKLVTN
jgi:hypothetical protein